MIRISHIFHICEMCIYNFKHDNTTKSMLKERSGRKLMRGGGGGTYGTYRSGDLIMEGVRRAGHRFEMDKRTPGDGNCFPRAAKQQCDRPAVEVNSIISHEDLRRKVTLYMLESEDRVVVDMRRRWEELEVRRSWESYGQGMADDGVWVEEVFIWATAWYLAGDIWIVWDTASPQAPITFFSGDREGNGTVCPNAALIIGHVLSGAAIGLLFINVKSEHSLADFPAMSFVFYKSVVLADQQNVCICI